ncbi:MAG TPA: hypothetical protein VIG69_14655, partial [Candidatus Methylomirabilis sp.]
MDLVRALGPWAGWAVAGLLILAFLFHPMEQARRAWHLAKRVKAKVGLVAGVGGPPVSPASASARIEPGSGGVAILADFESQGDLDVFAPVDGLAASLTAEHVTHG